MAALERPTEATYTIHEQVTVDTSDHEDHTFCGIMFPVKAKELLPLDHVLITSVSVRGRLGPLTVWVSNEDDPAHQNQSFRLAPRHWTKIYERTHAPCGRLRGSGQQYSKLDFSQNPIRLSPGQVRAIYVHSALPGDEAIVYDNRHSRRTYDDAILSVLTGRAHVSERPFGTTPIWGWGNPWRDNREFVGKIEFGAVYRLWNPNTFLSFGSKFQTLTRTLFLCQRRWESPMSRLPDDCIFYILNMCRWDWAGDDQETMKELRKRKQAREMAAALEEATATADGEEDQEDVAMAIPDEQEENAAAAHAVSSCCQRAVAQGGEESEDSEYNDEEEEEEADEDSDEEVELYEDEAGNVYRVVDASEDVDIEEVDADDFDDEEDDDEDWEEDLDFGGRDNIFSYNDDSDDDEDRSDEQGRRAWIRRQFARIHVLQALNVQGRANEDNDSM